MMAKRKTKEIDAKGLEDAAECLRTLSHPHRLRMVQMLLREELTVGELAEACQIQSHVASDHLGRMKDRGLLASRREGRHTFYRIAEKGLVGIMECVESRFGGK